jgi:hypothetical protein
MSDIPNVLGRQSDESRRAIAEATPTTDKSSLYGVRPNIKPPGLNSLGEWEIMSIATTDFDAPKNPPPYWSSGQKKTLTILE